MLHRHILSPSLGYALLAMTLTLSTASAAPAYPAAERGTVVDDYQGTTIADPYRWMEDPTAPATREFVHAQNALAQPWLEALPQRERLKQRLTQLWNYERVGLPRVKGGQYFFVRNDGIQNQSVLYVADSLTATPRVLFDPNAASSDATVALARFEPSPDGKVVAYSLSDGGTDWEIWKFRRVADGVDLPDELRQTKFWSLSWAPDGSGVYYSRYPARTDDAGRGDDQAQPVVHFHKMGTPQSADRAIYQVTDHPRRAPGASVSDDGRWLFVSLFDGYRAYVKDARGIARIFNRNGAPLGEVASPGLGTVGGFGGNGKDTETFFAYTDYLTPGRVLRLDIGTQAVSTWREPKIAGDTSPYVTKQVFYTSQDGTRVPMFITHRKDLVKTGDTPTMLYGYGGFNVSLTPSFSPTVFAWLEMGGVYAVANLRGGGEYGDAWHEAGTKLKKQNVFDDFIAAAEFLVRDGWTNPARLAISGRSNGGLLVGAVMLQRPDLFAAALPGVGVLDMLRYHTASANARQWSSDYGLSENVEEFRALSAYSPVHNVKPGVCYPATLVTTADRDDRVVPWHSYKFAAELQRAQGCATPILLRVETRAGHGAGKPTWMQIEDFADQWAFAAQAIGLGAD